MMALRKSRKHVARFGQQNTLPENTPVIYNASIYFKRNVSLQS